MYKKIFSAILFGALTIASTSTFVSCKDYDDDINNLQAQIDELNQQKLVTINNSIDALKKADTDLQKAITDGDAATLAAAKTLIAEAISDCQEACKTNLATSQAAQDAKFDEAITKVNQRVDDIVKLLSDQDGNIQQVGKDLKALSDKLATFEAQYGNLTTAFTDLTQRVTNLEDAVKAQKAALEEQKNALDDLAAKLSGQPGSNGYDDTALKNDIKGAQTRIDGIEKSVKDLQDELTKKFNELTEKLNNVSGDLNDLKQAHTDFASQVTNQLTELTNNINNVKAQAEKTAEELGALDVMFKILVNDLRSLVYMPKLYVDGIETIEYPYLKLALLHKQDVATLTRKEADDQKAIFDGRLVNEQLHINGLEDFVDKTLNDSIAYGPVWPIQYHMNPGNASTEYANIKGYYAYEAEVLTRAFYDTKNNAAGTWGIVPADRWVNQYENNAPSNMIWDKKNGIMTIGLQITKPESIDNPGMPGTNHFPTDYPEDYNDNKSPESVKNVILALQANSKKAVADYAGAGKDTVITSDYAQVVMEKVKLEGLIWRKGVTPKYWDNENNRIKDFWENKKGYGPAYAQAPTVHPQTGLPNTYGDGNPAGWDYGYRKGTQNTTMGRDTICPVTRDWIHVWATPQEALLHPADIELYTNRDVVLSEHLGVHWYFEQNEPLTENVAGHGNGVNKVQTWKYDDVELRRYGFVWVFDTVDYYLEKNETYDSRYVIFTDHKNGTIRAKNVDELGQTDGINSANHSAVDREPLVRVRLYHFTNIKDMAKWQNIDEYKGIDKFNADNAVASGNYAPVLDGYIRIHITRPELKEINDYQYPFRPTFDLCNDWPLRFTQPLDVSTPKGHFTTWAQFDKWVLQKNMGNMQKDQFDASYKPELDNSANAMVRDFNGGKMYEMVQYSKPSGSTNDNEFYHYKNLEMPSEVKSNPIKPTDKIGHIYQIYDLDGTTNYAYAWEISAEEMEALTHDQAPWNKEVKIERYIHYTGHFYDSADPNNTGAYYDDIFIKLTMIIDRSEVPTSLTSKKDENYWYKADGSWNGWFDLQTADGLQSVAINTPYPKDVDDPAVRPTIPWTYELRAAWDQNKIVASNKVKSKLYIAPFEYKITALDGTVYMVTPKRGNGDNIFNNYFCKYWNEKHPYQLDQNNPFNSAELLKNNERFKQCAIRYEPLYNDVINAYPGVAATYATAAAYAGHESEFPRIDGVFSNDTLYAYVVSGPDTKRFNSAQHHVGANSPEYEPIAIINNQDPENGADITLLHEYVNNKWLDTKNCYSDNHVGEENEIAEACLNAVGYDLKKIGKQIFDGDLELLTGEFEDHGNPIGKQLRAYLGVIATQKCNIVNQMNDKEDPKNFTVFQASWERPINILEEADFMVDAINNGDYIYMVDLLKLFDWRGASNIPVRQGALTDTGYMWGDTGIPSHWTVTNWRPNQWLWAYYGVKEITMDLRTSAVQTNLSQTNPANFVPMSSISNMVRLTGNGTPGGKNRNVVAFDLRNPIDYANHDMNTDLINAMGLNHARMEGIDVTKAKFGYIFYENNELNVQDFKIKVPVTVTYDWGVILDQPLVINVHFTRGNTTTNP